MKTVWFFSGVGFVAGTASGIASSRVGSIVPSIWNFFSFLGGA